MPDIAAILTEGAANPWLYLPAAILLGALHALEPGHSKSIMAAFIIAIRGTASQAVLLGVAAAIGHTIVVWGLVLAALWFGADLIEQKAYPWLVLVSGVMILAIALRLFWTLRQQHAHGHHPHGGHGPQAHDHGDHDHRHDHGHAAHSHDHDHSHDSHAPDHHGHSHASPEEIAARFAGRRVKSWEIVWFGFTGGLLPCPSAIAVLLVALKLNAVALGAAMVGAFSLGLAATLVSVGLIAAWGTRRAASWSGFERATRWLPLVSVSIVLLLGVGVSIHGVMLVRAVL